MISEEIRKRNPLISTGGMQTLLRLQEHPDAPRWNYQCGDRIQKTDLVLIERFRQLVFQEREVFGKTPSPLLLQELAGILPKVSFYRKTLPPTVNFESNWHKIPTISRENLSGTPEDFMPDDCDMERLIVHRTSGTTGHPILIPSHPVAGSNYFPMMEFALANHGVNLSLDENVVSTFLLCAQAYTITYATVHAAWSNSGFAKINLQKGEWPKPDSVHRYFEELSPLIWTGDPISFSEAMRQKIHQKPKALFSTAVRLSPSIKKRLKETYCAPIIDWYSSNETGPIAYTCSQEKFHCLSPDIFLEVLDPAGNILPAGARGELTVTVLRNPYLPLLRYRMGDFGRIETKPCSCGDPMPQIIDLEGRDPVFFRAENGSIVNPVDLSRVFQKFPLLQHRLIQQKERSFLLEIRPIPNTEPIEESALLVALQELLGENTQISVRYTEFFQENQMGKKIISYQNKTENIIV